MKTCQIFKIDNKFIIVTLYRLESFLDGDIYEMIDALITTDQAEKLKQVG